MITPKQVLLTITGIVLLIALAMWGWPQYKVYSSRLHGEAELQRATYNRQIIAQEALAKKNASIDLAAADTVRAHGIARSNEIIGNSLRDNKAYLNWLWIDNIKNQKGVIYVPTEASLPILEATRLQKTQTIEP